MGGLGKTTLVGKVYERVKAHFEFSAWVTVSQTFSIEEIFRSMIGGADAMGKDKLIEKLRSHLQQKRYVIVIDDLWKVDDWECIKIGLPNGKHGSRIIVTTRINEAAAACARTSDRVYNLKPLPFEQGWVLFCRKAFQSDLGGNCPPDLQPLSQKIVRKCGGLPLAIAAIGSLLSTKTKTSVEWQKLYDRLGHQIESSNSLTIMNQILLLSYDDLPYYLKPCFMYVSIFPEDYLIKPMRLIRLWIGEGFVEKKEGMALEEVADDYLHELINRSLIQVASYTDYGTFKACRVHDVVREIILSKAREEKFATFLIGTNPSDKTRRLGMDYHRGIVPKKNLSHVRTVVMFRGERLSDSLMKDFSGFRLLKVLDLEGTGIEKFPSKIVNLLHLRLMSLRNTLIMTLPESIGKLKNLEMLDLHGTQIQELPASIFRLQNLCILIARPCSTTRMGGIKMTDGVGSLRSLQQLGYIKADQGNGDVIQELGKLTQLKWLGISELKSEDGLGLCASIEKMTCLSSLSISSVKMGIASRRGLLDLKYLSAPPHLGHVDLIGHLEELPHWIPLLSNLVCLRLEYSRLEEDPFNAPQHLSNLIQLKLDGAYGGKELCCKGGGFQRLNSLTLCRLERLKLVRLEKGAMSSLQKLSIRSCMSLMTVPFGIEHLTHLKVIEFVNLRTEFWKNIKEGKGAERWKISHVPDVKVDMSTGLNEDWRGLFED